jgi:histidinol-phosphate aminotransferase
MQDGGARARFAEHEGCRVTVDQTPRSSWLTDAIRGFPPYRGPQTAADFPANGPGVRPIRFLHLNESPYPPSPHAIEAAGKAIVDLNRYPDIHGRALANALSERTGVPANRIIFGAGSDELIHFLCEIALTHGDELVTPAPTFPRYAISARLLGAKPVRTRLTPNGANDAKALAAAVTERTRVVFCCTPNNPSGAFMEEAALEELIARVPDSVLLVVDEAYYEFGRYAGAPDVLRLLKRRRGPWAVLRTFSKAYGLAALRVGYALCGADDIADALRKAKLQYNVNTVAQAAALAALEDDAHLVRTLDDSARERKRLSDGLAALGIAPFPSAANFVSGLMPFAASLAMEELRKRCILIRDWRDPDHLNEIRITLGLSDDTDAVLAALREILADRAEPQRAAR